MPRTRAMRAALVGIGANMLLLALKATATGLSDSLTIFSETLNSLSDVVSAVVILLCVRWAWMLPDDDHPFGHRRAEPIAALVVAIFTGILGFEVCRTAVLHLWSGELPQRIGPYPVIALCITASIKAALAIYFTRRGQESNSPALRATAIDCRNDVIIAAQGMAGVLIAQYQLRTLDVIAALVVGLYILFSAYRMGMENVDYLMGRAPDAELLRRIRVAAEGVAGVQKVEDIKGHYVGTFVQVELTARVDGALSTEHSHEVAESARQAIESLPNVDRAFVHIEPA